MDTVEIIEKRLSPQYEEFYLYAWGNSEGMGRVVECIDNRAQ